MAGPVWVVVLIRNLDHAKTRLAPALDPARRRKLAEENAHRALAAARAGDAVLVVTDAPAVVDLASAQGIEAVLEIQGTGQNPAARLGISVASGRGAGAVLLLSSDLPLVSRQTVAAMLDAGRKLPSPVVVAAAARGRGGTNALYLSPPEAVGMQFGDRSLVRFRSEAASRNVRFEIHRSPALALDLDTPDDLETLAAMATPA